MYIMASTFSDPVSISADAVMLDLRRFVDVLSKDNASVEAP